MPRYSKVFEPYRARRCPDSGNTTENREKRGKEEAKKGRRRGLGIPFLTQLTNQWGRREA